MAQSRPARFLRILFVILLIAGIAAVSREWWLPAIGRALIHDDGPGKADIAVVLAGDYWGNRIVKAGELVRQGYVPAAPKGAEMASSAMRLLTDAKARPEVRAEAAKALGIAEPTADRWWAYARAWLIRDLEEKGAPAEA